MHLVFITNLVKPLVTPKKRCSREAFGGRGKEKESRVELNTGEFTGQ